MQAKFSINPQDGTILIGPAHRLVCGQLAMELKGELSKWVSGTRYHRNGYEWLDLAGLTFGGNKAGLSLCFHDGRFVQAAWSVALPNAPAEGGWPTREAIDAEIGFVRAVLSREIGFDTTAGTMSFPWGEVWSAFDSKGFQASNGLRYCLPSATLSG